jgi:protein TonB
MPKVFVADRDSISRKGLAHALRQRGIDVEEFQSGPALFARALAGDPDLIVLDTDLEEMDGFQVFARLERKRPERPFPVLFVTDFDHPRVARICRERGAVGYVAKSRPQEQIVDAILDVIERPEPLAGRTLSAALAWLQSRGKTGRLDVEDGERAGYVLLHKGRVLDAEWGRWRGEDVLLAFAETNTTATFRFAEGIDDLERPAGAAQPTYGDLASRAAAPAVPTDPVTSPAASAERRPGRAAHAREKPSKPEPRPGRPPPETPAVASERTIVAPRWRIPLHLPPTDAPEPTATGGALAALHELQQARRARRISGRKRRALAAAAAAALIVTASVGLAALYSGPLPAPVRQVLTLIRLGEGGAVASVPRPQPRVADGAPSVSPAGELAPSSAPPAAVVPAGRPEEDAAGRPDEDTAGRFDVTPSSTGSYGSSFGPDAERAAAGPATTTDTRRAEARSEPAKGDAPSPASSASESSRKPDRAESAPLPADRDRTALVSPPAAAPKPDRRGDCREGWTDAFCLGAAGAGEADAPESVPPVSRQPTLEPAPGVPQPSVSPEPVSAAGDQIAESGAATAERDPVPVPNPAEARTADRSDAPSRTATAAPAGQPLLEKPILLKRGEGLYYPPELKAQGVGGNVLLKIRVGDNGRAQQVEIAQSSGYDAFDQAAVAAVGTFLWEPARNADGATEAWITQAVTFRP